MATIDCRKNIAVFDFDGTVTSKDSFLDFIFKNKGYYKLIKGVFFLLPILLLNRLKIVSSHVAKERVFSYFYSGTEEKYFNDCCEKYSLECISEIVKKKALSRIDYHKRQNHELVIISASLENWIKPWAFRHGFKEVIATVPEIQNGIITGKFRTKNCKGKEKVRRFLAKYPQRDKYFLYVYGDSRGDWEMMQLADKAFFRRFE